MHSCLHFNMGDTNSRAALLRSVLPHAFVCSPPTHGRVPPRCNHHQMLQKPCAHVLIHNKSHNRIFVLPCCARVPLLLRAFCKLAITTRLNVFCALTVQHCSMTQHSEDRALLSVAGVLAATAHSTSWATTTGWRLVAHTTHIPPDNQQMYMILHNSDMLIRVTCRCARCCCACSTSWAVTTGWKISRVSRATRRTRRCRSTRGRTPRCGSCRTW